MSMRFIKSSLWLVLLLLGVSQLAVAARTTTYFHTDGLGSVVAASDQSGAVLWRKTYAQFGEQTDTQADNERLAFTGKPHDDATGLTYFGGRYYDPAIGRFASVDPVGFVESNPMSFNRYLYVNNNPYKYVDPDGEFLNFAAKFVLDVGINIAFNYVTTGSMGVGSALKESATGILNPAKTVAKAGKLLVLTAKAKKTGRITKSGGGGGANFVVTSDGVAIPTNPNQLKANLSKLSDQSTNAASSRKFVGEDSLGPLRVRVEKAHPADPNFTGKPDPLHTVDHLHIDRRTNGKSGPWRSKEKTSYAWPF